METDYSHKIQSLIFLRYAELFTNYAFVDHETAIDLMAGEIQTLRTELQQYKEALRLATNDAEKEIGCPPAENRACCKWQGDHSPCIDCITNYYLTKAKGGQ
jgi:hypothetical protein